MNQEKIFQEKLKDLIGENETLKKEQDKAKVNIIKQIKYIESARPGEQSTMNETNAYTSTSPIRVPKFQQNTSGQVEEVTEIKKDTDKKTLMSHSVMELLDILHSLITKNIATDQ